METWLRASIVHGFADATFIPDTRSPGAVCTVKYHKDKASSWNTSIAQLVLAMASTRTGNGLVGVISEVNITSRSAASTTSSSAPRLQTGGPRVGEHLGIKHGKGEYVFRLLL